MFKHLLVPLDGSALAEAALPAAVFFSDKLKARVTLLHIIEKDSPAAVHGQPHLQNHMEAEAYLKKTAGRFFPPETIVDSHVHTAAVDNVAESIVAHSDELPHDLIVMCSHGRGKALHLFLGSIAQKVIAMGSIPVLMTYPRKEGDMPDYICKNILLPLDDNPDHFKAVSVVQKLAGAFGASLHLVTAVPDFTDLSGRHAVTSRFLPGTTTKILELSVQQTDAYLQNQIKTLRDLGVSASAHILRGDPATVIVESARRLKIDLTVMATHGKSGMAAFWAGSVAHRVCSQGRLPLLLVPAGKEIGPERKF